MPSNYYPAQIHWHTPSEHATADVKDGTPVYYDAEAHIVHANSAGDEYSVLGIFFDVPENPKDAKDGENVFVKNFLEGFEDRQVADDDADKPKIDMSLLIKELKTEAGFWMYDGSLTTPPCLEAVKWTVMKGALTIS